MTNINIIKEKLNLVDLNIIQPDELESKYSIYSSSIDNDIQEILLETLDSIGKLYLETIIKNDEYNKYLKEQIDLINFDGGDATSHGGLPVLPASSRDDLKQSKLFNHEKVMQVNKKLLFDKINFDMLIGIIEKYKLYGTLNIILYCMMILLKDLRATIIQFDNKFYLCGITTKHKLFDNISIYIFESEFQEHGFINEYDLEALTNELQLRGFSNIIYVYPYKDKNYLPIKQDVNFCLRVNVEILLKEVFDILTNEDFYNSYLESVCNYQSDIKISMTKFSYDSLRQKLDARKKLLIENPEVEDNENLFYITYEPIIINIEINTNKLDDDETNDEKINDEVNEEANDETNDVKNIEENNDLEELD